MLKILLVDDDEDDYVWIRRVLAAEDTVRVDWVASYEEGCAALQARAHDVILVDYRLRDTEGRDGLDLVRKAREEQATTPCVLFTGAPRVGLEIASLSAGAAAFLAKSEFSHSRLMHAILQALERSKTESELFRKNRALSLILRATEAAHEAPSEDRAFQACLADVCAELGWELSDALLVVDSGALALSALHACHPAGGAQLGEVRSRLLPDTQLWPLAQVLRSRQRVLCDDVAACGDCAYRELTRAGVRCALLVPVVVRGEVVAVLELFSAQARVPDATDNEILTAVAAQLAQSVVRARAEAQRQHAEAELRRSQRLVSTQDVRGHRHRDHLALESRL